VKGREMEEPSEVLGDDLAERLKSSRNRVDIALILIDIDRRDLVYTMLEDLFYGAQIIIDKYCLKEVT